MKRNFFTLLLLLTYLSIFGQAKKPDIMVVPSDQWMKKNGYMDEYYDQGRIQYAPNYRKALMENFDTKNVLSKISDLFTARGFKPKMLENELKNLEIADAERNAFNSKKGAGELATNPVDQLREVANADIIVYIHYEVRNEGPKKYVQFNMEGIDAYTSNPCGYAPDDPSAVKSSFQNDISILLSEAVSASIDNFCAKLQAHFDDMFKNGRLVKITVMRFENWEYDLESENFGQGERELNELIETWVSDNTMGRGKYNLKNSSEDIMVFEAVRIPLFGKVNNNEQSLTAKLWSRGLQDYLKTLKIVSKVKSKGLGEAQIILGGK